MKITRIKVSKVIDEMQKKLKEYATLSCNELKNGHHQEALEFFYQAKGAASMLTLVPADHYVLELLDCYKILTSLEEDLVEVGVLEEDLI